MSNFQREVTYLDIRDLKNVIEQKCSFTIKKDGYLWTDRGENFSIHVALMYAVKKNATNMAKQCIEKGGDINVKIFGGDSLVNYVVEKNNLELLELLISKGVNLNVKTDGKETLLHIAVRYGCAKIVDMLIDNGVKLNLKDAWGNTALMIACESRRAIIAKLLLEKGADVSVKPKRHNSLLDLVVDNTPTYDMSFDLAAIDNTAIIDILKQHGAK